MNGDVLDTNIVIKYLAGDEITKQLLDRALIIYIPVIVVGELHYGAQKSSRIQRNLEIFNNFLSNFQIISVDMDIAENYGIIKNQLRAKGINIPENDIWIDASTKSRQCNLLTYDSHFKSIDNLIVKP